MPRQNRTRSTGSNEPGSSTVLDACAAGRGSLRGDEQGEAVSDMKGEKADDERNGWGVSEWIHALAAQSRGGRHGDQQRGAVPGHPGAAPARLRGKARCVGRDSIDPHRRPGGHARPADGDAIRCPDGRAGCREGPHGQHVRG